MGWAYYMMLRNYNGILTDTGFLYALVIILTFTGGSCLVMWLGEQIDQFGIGNGISMILFAGIISRIPSQVGALITGLSSGALAWYLAVLLLVGIALLVVVIVFITNSERRIPVQYAKRQVGRRVYGGQSTFLPIKVNMSGVLPVIFAQSIVSLPATIVAFVGVAETGFWAWMNKYVFSSQSVGVLRDLLPADHRFQLLLTLLCSSTPIEIANNMKKNGGFIPRLPSGQAHFRLHCQGHQQGYALRRHLPGVRGAAAGDPGRRCGGQPAGHRRHFRHHRGGCCPGDHQGSGGPDAHAALQGLPGVIGGT